MSQDHYDVIVIGSGPGGASLVQKLAPTGKRILLLERGDYLPRSFANWDSGTVFVDGAYQTKEVWHASNGDSFSPGLHYYVGGNSKVYGAALLRLRERDFEAVRHVDGVSPAWPLGYEVFEPFYAEAEALFHVHGARGEDPNEPWSSGPFPYPAVSHEPRIVKLDAQLRGQGLKPFHLPLGILLDEKDGKQTPTSPCIRCDAFDGFPCAMNGKADAQVICVDPTIAAYPNVTLLTGAYVSKLQTDASGRTITGVCVTRAGAEEIYTADIVVVACGALSSALLLLRSANDRVPARDSPMARPRSDRNYMRHNMQRPDGAAEASANETVFQKTLALQRFLLRRQGLAIPDGPDSDVRHLAWRADQGRGPAVLAEVGCRRCRSTRWRNTPWISGCRARICRVRKIASTTTTGARWVLDITEGERTWRRCSGCAHKLQKA